MKTDTETIVMLKKMVLCGVVLLSQLFGISYSAELLLDRNATIELAKSITQDVYPNADEVLVDDYIRDIYHTDGTGVTYDDYYVKVLTEKGKTANQTLSLGFTLPYEEVKVHALEVIKPDGTIVPVDVEGQSKVMIDPSQMGSNIYNPNSKIFMVGIPGLQVGDTIHYFIEKNKIKPRMPNQFSDIQIFESVNPIKHYLYEVVAPKEMPLRSIALKAEIKGTVTSSQKETDEHIIYTWEANDVPRIFEEPDMPDYWTVVQRLLISTNPDWETVSKWYWELSEPHFAVTDEIKAKVAELVDGISNRHEKIAAIFRFVSQDIRYLGITVEKDAPGYEPHDVSMTFDNRHGVCRDKAALLVAMLREAGFEAFPVLIHNGPKRDMEVPLPYFNHAISAVREPDGSYRLMDSTDENTKQLLPSYLNDCSYLVATPEGETLRVSPIIPAEKNMLYIDTAAKLTADGTLTAQSKIRFEGINDNAYRGYFAKISPDERKQLFEAVVKRAVPGAKLTAFELLPENMLDTTQAMQVTMAYEAQDVLVSNGDKTMMPNFGLGTRMGMVNFVIGQTGLKERRFPLKTRYACGVRETLNIDYNESIGKVVSLPTYQPIDSDTLSWKRSVENGDGTINIASEFKLKVVMFDPDEYLGLKEALKQIEYESRKKTIFDAGIRGFDVDGADAVVVSDVTDITLESTTSWTEKQTVKKTVLTYKGKKENSEIKISYNPAEEEVKVVYAKVTTDGQTKEISTQEINLMDAGWAASAPRYPAGKTLVASLPGVEIGSEIEYCIERQIKHKPFFAMLETFGGFDPIQRKQIHLTAPAAIAKQWQVRVDQDGIAYNHEDAEKIIHTRDKAGEETVEYWWTAENVPAIKREQNLPPLYTFKPAVTVSTGNWADYRESIHKRIDAATVETDQCSEKAKALVEDAKNNWEKVIVVRDFVAKNIRNAGPGLAGLPLDTISTPDVTLHDGYGNSTDRAILISAMLKAAGVENEIVLSSRMLRMKAVENFFSHMPFRSIFNVVLVKINLDRGPVYLNDTNQYAPLGATASDGYLGMNLGTDGFERIAAMEHKATKTAMTYTIKLSDEGDADIRSETSLYGIAFSNENKRYSEMSPEERDRHFQEMVIGLSQSATATSPLMTNFDGEDRPNIAFSARVEKFAVRDGDYLYLTVPSAFQDFFGIRGDTRDNPFCFESKAEFTVTVNLQLPETFTKASLLPNKGVRELDDTAEFGIRIEDSAPHVLSLTYTCRIRPGIIPAERYPEMLKLSKWLTHSKNRVILLEKSTK